MTARKLFHSIVGYGMALTAVVEIGGACSSPHHRIMREGPPPPPCSTQQACELTGRVTDADGKPVANATLRVGRAQTTTDADGKYKLSGIMDNWDTIEVVTADQQRSVHPTNLHYGGTVQRDLQLDRQEPPP